MLDRQMEILNDMETLTSDTYDMMKLQKDLRGARETAVVSAEASMLGVKSQKIEMQRQILSVENSLSLLIGQNAQKIARGRLEDQRLPEKFSTGCSVNLLANRPDVHAAEMNMANCFYAVETARSRFYPNITVTGTAAFTNSGGGAIINPGKWLLSAVASLVQPIFQHGQIVAGLKVAKAQYEQAYNTWQNAVLKAGNEVSNALVSYNSSAEKAELDGKRGQVLKQNVEDTKKLMESSSNTTYLEVISAQSNLLNAEIAEVTDQFNKMQAVVNLYQALGGGAK
jgi:outer membrane protein TolC